MKIGKLTKFPKTERFGAISIKAFTASILRANFLPLVLLNINISELTRLDCADEISFASVIHSKGATYWTMRNSLTEGLDRKKSKSRDDRLSTCSSHLTCINA